MSAKLARGERQFGHRSPISTIVITSIVQADASLQLYSLEHVGQQLRCSQHSSERATVMMVKRYVYVTTPRPRWVVYEYKEEEQRTLLLAAIGANMVPEKNITGSSKPWSMFDEHHLEVVFDPMR